MQWRDAAAIPDPKPAFKSLLHAGGTKLANADAKLANVDAKRISLQGRGRVMAKARGKRSWSKRFTGDSKTSQAPPSRPGATLAEPRQAAPAPVATVAAAAPESAPAPFDLSAPVAEAPATEVGAPQSFDENAAAPLAQMLASLGEGAAYVHVFDGNSRPHAVGKGLNHALVSNGASRLRLADGDPKASSGGFTQGYSVRLPDEIERAASGRNIVVRWLARSPEAPQARVACAYSTCEVGNSGWRWKGFDAEWSLQSFTFKVAPMVKGNGDFVGFLPAAPGEPAIEIAGFAIDILPET